MTLTLKPPVGAIVIVLVPLEPGEMVRLSGEAERLKLGVVVDAVPTVRLSAAEWVKLPEVPVSVTG